LTFLPESPCVWSHVPTTLIQLTLFIITVNRAKCSALDLQIAGWCSPQCHVTRNRFLTVSFQSAQVKFNYSCACHWGIWGSGLKPIRKFITTCTWSFSFRIRPFLPLQKDIPVSTEKEVWWVPGWYGCSWEGGGGRVKAYSPIYFSMSWCLFLYIIKTTAEASQFNLNNINKWYSIFWDITHSWLVVIYRRFGTYRPIFFRNVCNCQYTMRKILEEQGALLQGAETWNRAINKGVNK
jgi:hypothetical protein